MLFKFCPYLKGIFVLNDFIDLNEETHLIESINQREWKESQSGRERERERILLLFLEIKIIKPIIFVFPA